MRNSASILFMLTALAFLLPGVSEPMFFMDLKCMVVSGFGNMEFDILNSSYSLLGTIQNLLDRDKAIVGLLILVFSLLVPLVKTLVFFILAIDGNIGNFSSTTPETVNSMGALRRFLKSRRQCMLKFLALSSKWSMADVFVVAIFLTYMASSAETQSSTHQINVMGMALKVKVDLLMKSELQAGFYYFLGYCLLSLAATSLADFDRKEG